MEREPGSAAPLTLKGRTPSPLLPPASVPFSSVFCSHFLASHLSVVNLFPADCFHPTPDADGSTCFTHFWFPTLPFSAGGAGGVCCDHRSERAERVQVSSTFLGPPIQELFRSDPDGLGMIRNTPVFRSSFFPASSYLTYPAPIS